MSLTREEVVRRLVDHERRCQKFTTPDTHAIKQALQTALAAMDERDALAAEGRLLREALEQLYQDTGGSTRDWFYEARETAEDVLNSTRLITAEVERVRRLEAVLEAAKALIDSRGAHIEGCVPLKNAIAAYREGEK